MAGEALLQNFTASVAQAWRRPEARQIKQPRSSIITCVSAAPQMSGSGSNDAAAAVFIRPHLLKLAPYTPIEPFEVLSAKLGRRPEDIVKLDANENPYGPPPEVLAALGSLQFPHIYPDPESRKLRAALAEWNDVPIEHLLVRHTFLAALKPLPCMRLQHMPLSMPATESTAHR
jgi:hypothetical protein